MSKHPADGTYVTISDPAFDPTVLLTFRDATPGLTDADIMTKVRYVQPDAPEVARMGAGYTCRYINLRESIPDMNHCLALWPDGVLVILSFSKEFRKQRSLQLLRAYRNGRHAKAALQFSNQQAMGRTS